MITGMHAVVYSKEAERAREFFRDILRLDSVDAGGGWLIFALPPSELAVHPTDGDGSHELFLVCDDVEQTTRELALKGVSTVEPITEQRWGRLTRLRLPSGDEIGLYEPRHPQPGAGGQNQDAQGR
jgi:predicted enzyme related to lactoylglutathione lyase